MVLIADVEALLASLGGKPNPILGFAVNSTNASISGATVNLVNASKTVLAKATTDGTGWYYFPLTSGLVGGQNYTVSVTLPKGYKASTPASQTYTWSGAEIDLKTFVLK
jgi:hypothetical protein